VIDAVALQMVLGVLTGWLDRREREAIAYLVEENRLYDVNLVDGGCVSPTRIDVGWRRERTELALQSCVRLPRSRRRIPCCGGIVS